MFQPAKYAADLLPPELERLTQIMGETSRGGIVIGTLGSCEWVGRRGIAYWRGVGWGGFGAGSGLGWVWACNVGHGARGTERVWLGTERVWLGTSRVWLGTSDTRRWRVLPIARRVLREGTGGEGRSRGGGCRHGRPACRPDDDRSPFVKRRVQCQALRVWRKVSARAFRVEC